MKVRITYHSGLVEEYEAEAKTVEGLINEKFGSTFEAFQENGGKIEVWNPEAGEAGEYQLAAFDAPQEDPQAITGTVNNFRGDVSLFGSDTLNAELQVGESTIQLGTLVSAAHTASGLTVEEWNALDPVKRDEMLLNELEVMRAVE